MPVRNENVPWESGGPEFHSLPVTGDSIFPFIKMGALCSMGGSKEL